MEEPQVREADLLLWPGDSPLVDEGKAVDVVCLDFSKAFDTVPLVSS